MYPWRDFIMLAIALACSFQAEARGPESVEPLGRHFRLFRFEKNENPQNVLIGYTKLARNCRFEQSHGKPIVDFYWLLDGTRFKNPNWLVKKNIWNRLAFTKSTPTLLTETDSFAVRLVESKELNAPVKSAVIRVSARKTGSDCDVSVVATFSEPSGKEDEISLSTIRAETRKTWLPPFRKIVSITLEGQSVANGRPVTQIFN